MNTTLNPIAATHRLCGYLIKLLALTAGLNADASSVLLLLLDEQLEASSAVFRGTTLQVEAFMNPADGLIYARAAVRVDEGFKGTLSPVLNLLEPVSNRELM